MSATTLHERAGIAVIDYRCEAHRHDKPFTEVHTGFSLSYVRTGSFGYRQCGRAFDLVAGAVLVGNPGDEYVCSHDHVCGDECISFQLAPAVVESIGVRAA
ncbi:MAG: AraC family transcriptional regulator, partial [Myxococcales bacterium]|nr:AraC family transcriptional regulator [Myxococcales bacterium]